MLRKRCESGIATDPGDTELRMDGTAGSSIDLDIG